MLPNTSLFLPNFYPSFFEIRRSAVQISNMQAFPNMRKQLTSFFFLKIMKSSKNCIFLEFYCSLPVSSSMETPPPPPPPIETKSAGFNKNVEISFSYKIKEQMPVLQKFYFNCMRFNPKSKTWEIAKVGRCITTIHKLVSRLPRNQVKNY